MFRRAIVIGAGSAEALDWLAPLLMRLFFGTFWILTGWAKVNDLASFAQRFAGWGIPYPYLNAALSAYTELIGGSLLLIGLVTRLVTLPMMFNMVIAIVAVTGKQMHGIGDFIFADEPLYILILFWLLMAGPGRASLDHVVSSALSLNRDAEPSPASIPAIIRYRRGLGG